MTLGELVRANPILRGALVAPSVVVLIFCLFNLTAVVDQAAVLRTLTVAIVHQDAGVPAPLPLGTFRLGDQALAALERQMPLRTARFEDVNSATDALDDGIVVAVLVLPPDFTATAVAGNPPQVELIVSEHLSVLETQVGRQLSQQVQAALSFVVVVARPQLAALRPFAAAPTRAAPAPAATAAPRERGEPVVPAVPVPPVAVRSLEAPPATPLDAIGVPAGQGLPVAPPAPLQVVTTTLHTAPNGLLLQAPFVMGFAAWMGALVGSILLFFGTRRPLAAGNLGVVLGARTLFPLLASVLAALIGVITVAALTNVWDHFWQLWAFRWLVMAAALTTMTALFSVLGFFAFLMAVPLVFYQSVVAGALAPPAAAPEWIAWLGHLPLADMTRGVRALLIGGPIDAVQWVNIAMLLGAAMVVVWTGTVLWGARRRPRG